MNVLITLWNIVIALIQNIGPLFFTAGLILAFMYWVTFMFIVPAIEICREMKKGKTFWQACGAVFKNDGSFGTDLGITRNHCQNSCPSYQLDDMNTSSRYVGLPNNVFTNK
jgi:hypothetical protein